MSLFRTDTKEFLERARSSFFLIGGILFGVATALLIIAMMVRIDRSYLDLREALVAFGWVTPLLGLLGLPHGLVDKKHWLIRAGTDSVAIGVLSFFTLGSAFLFAFSTGARPDGIPMSLVIAGSLIGSFLAFSSFSIAIYRSPSGSRLLSTLVFLPSIIFIVNLVILPIVIGSGPKPPATDGIITSSLAVTMVAIAYVTHAGVTNRPN